MCTSTEHESARASPMKSSGRTAAAGSPYAPSTCIHTPRSSQTSAIASSGSTAPVSVVPAVATTATGVTPAATSRSIASASASGRIRRKPSSGIARRLSEPIPSSSTARVTE